MNVELKPAGHLYPSVVLTQEELTAVLEMLSIEFEWNKNWKKEYPALDRAYAKLEMFEEDYTTIRKRLSSSEAGKTKRSKANGSL